MAVSVPLVEPARSPASPAGDPAHILVVGGGHAGVEAALAAIRTGARVSLITLDPSALGRMSCNPSVGGLAKGQLAREVDALGGLMAVAADAASLQFRMLNTAKGPAVRGPRCQVDRERYAAFVRSTLESTPGITLVRGQVRSIVEQAGRFVALELTDGMRRYGDACVLTTGTFLRGLMHVGDQRSAGGRVGEGTAAELSASLTALGFELVRLKTGTPPRIDERSVDLDRLETLGGHPDDGQLSFRVPAPEGRVAVPTWRLDTHAATHDVVRRHLHRSPYGRGALESTGPRYCPSIEDKVVRFGDKPSHRIFVERETVHGPSLYLNGLSNCLPRDVQLELVRTLDGFGHAVMLRPGYAVEYDAVPACQLRASLESLGVERLFLAGQVNGTSGYEEAAAQGLMAGLNAVRAVRGESPAVLGRHEAYIGVLIDDLVTTSPREPYRMFTSRAEYRLLLRQDNADRRCMPRAVEWGLLSAADAARHQARVEAIDALSGRLGLDEQRRIRTGEELADVVDLDHAVAPDVVEQVELDVRYAGYVERQARTVAKVAALGRVPLAADVDYLSMEALRIEARQVLDRIRPQNLAQASRLAGVSPADLQLLALSSSATCPSSSTSTPDPA
jgi:tRNA uridine 5-carboxymethylaminomethyl modification enzyme